MRESALHRFAKSTRRSDNSLPITQNMSDLRITKMERPSFVRSSSTAGSTYVATALEALENWRKNEVRCWYKEDVDPNDPDGKFAFQRLRQDWFTPEVHPKFRFTRDDKFFAIGSCFARGLEGSLIKHKIVTESAAREFAVFAPLVLKGTALGITNKYNTFAILNDLRWALDPDAEFPIDSIVPVGDGTWLDPHVNPTLTRGTLEETLGRRRLLQSVTRRIRDCRAVIVTMGLIELWRDSEADVFLNMTPASQVHMTAPERYEFHISSYAQNWANLEAIHDLLSQYGHPDLRIVVTVSPVPLLNTFSTMDVVVANTYSKSLLRTLAQDWAMAHDNVDYFPSYEIVLNSERSLVWIDDRRHVTVAGRDHIMDVFLKSYLRDS